MLMTAVSALARVTMMDKHLVLGGPGCGKTTRLLEIVAEEMNTGIPASKIAFVAFTKAAAIEAKGRAAAGFALDPAKDLPWFRTIHSLAYGQVGVLRDEVMDRTDWGRFSKLVGMRVSGNRWYGESSNLGDQFLQMLDLARTTDRELRQTWEDAGGGVDWFALERFALTFEKFKKDCGKIDFTDMLVKYVQDCEPINVEVAVIDEAQDLTPLQWRVVDRAFANAHRIYIAGDDDQAIYQWAGADIEKFLNLDAQCEILPKSHRLPEPIHRLTRDIASRITERYQKNFSASGERAGEVKWHQHWRHVNFTERKGSWLILARNRYMLRDIVDWLRRIGHLYNFHAASSVKTVHERAIYGWQEWKAGKVTSAQQTKAILKLYDGGKRNQRVDPTCDHRPDEFGIDTRLKWHEALTGISMSDRWYYQACLRRKQPLHKEPRIRLDTIHGVKGAEADHVLLLTDMSARTYREYETKPDTEHRVYYVGVSRAKESLHLITPQSPNYYQI